MTPLIFLLLIGPVCGCIIGVIFLKTKVFSTKISILWLALGWAVALISLISIIQVLGIGLPATTALGITGAIGGTATGIILMAEKKITTWQSILWIAAGWSIALSISVNIYNSFAADGSYSQLFFLAIMLGLVFGAIGGFFTVWQIREAQKKRAFRQEST